MWPLCTSSPPWPPFFTCLHLYTDFPLGEAFLPLLQGTQSLPPKRGPSEPPACTLWRVFSVSGPRSLGPPSRESLGRKLKGCRSPVGLQLAQAEKSPRSQAAQDPTLVTPTDDRRSLWGAQMRNRLLGSGGGSWSQFPQVFLSSLLSLLLVSLFSSLPASCIIARLGVHLLACFSFHLKAGTPAQGRA